MSEKNLVRIFWFGFGPTISGFWMWDRGGSWIWKSLCKLRLLAHPFVVCEIGSGISESFWFNNWTSLGPLIELLGTNAPRITGLAETATVREALGGNQWWLNF